MKHNWFRLQTLPFKVFTPNMAPDDSVVSSTDIILCDSCYSGCLTTALADIIGHVPIVHLSGFWLISLEQMIIRRRKLARGVRLLTCSVLYKYSETETKWPPFCRRHLQMNLVQWKIKLSIQISLMNVPKGLISWQISMSSGNYITLTSVDRSNGVIRPHLAWWVNYSMPMVNTQLFAVLTINLTDSCDLCTDILHVQWHGAMLWWHQCQRRYSKWFRIRRTKSKNYIEARCEVETEGVVGAAPRGDAPTTSEWSTSSLLNTVELILEVRRSIHHATTYNKTWHSPVFSAHVTCKFMTVMSLECHCISSY